MSPQRFHDLHVHPVASAPDGRYAEFFPDDQLFNFRRLISRQLKTKDGKLLNWSGCDVEAGEGWGSS
jgi:hypothetical protein